MSYEVVPEYTGDFRVMCCGYEVHRFTDHEIALDVAFLLNFARGQRELMGQSPVDAPQCEHDWSEFSSFRDMERKQCCRCGKEIWRHKEA